MGADVQELDTVAEAFGEPGVGAGAHVVAGGGRAIHCEFERVEGRGAGFELDLESAAGVFELLLRMIEDVVLGVADEDLRVNNLGREEAHLWEAGDLHVLLVRGSNEHEASIVGEASVAC